jgi:formylmethanofuran dehydrogenase subunit E
LETNLFDGRQSMKKDDSNLEELLKEASEFHGDLCAGITLGTRMSIIGLDAIGIKDPKGKDRKNLIVYVETDRCASDAILAVTGCHPGKRSMKILDYGKMAATFINLNTGKAVRVVVKDKEEGNGQDQAAGQAEGRPLGGYYATAPSEDLFNVQKVSVVMKPEDMPGKPLRVVKCTACGERIMDMREVWRAKGVLCKPCADGKRYYEVKIDAQKKRVGHPARQPKSGS